MGQIDTDIADDTRDMSDSGPVSIETSAPPAMETAPSAADVADTHATTVKGFTIYDVLLLGMITIWAGNPAAIKWALQYMDPLAFNAIRFGLATLVPVSLMLVRRESFKWHRG